MSERRVPKWVNAIMKFMLRSPFHGSVSQSIMLITFTGRKTGNQYTTPVRYTRNEDKVIAFTQEKWWRNLQGSQMVELQLAGKRVKGVPNTVEGSHVPLETRLADFLRKFPSDAKYYAVRVDANGQPDAEDVRQAAPKSILLEIQI